MLHSGLGETHVTKFLAALEIPALQHNALKSREREIAKHIEQHARISCDKSMNEEIAFSSTSNDDIETSVEDSVPTNDRPLDSSTPVSIGIKYDMGWQKRSSGKKYDSLSGVGVVIGAKSGKVLDYGVRCKDCRVCSYSSRKGESVPAHDCHKNFEGSSKSMEPDVAGEIVSRMESTKPVRVDTLIMDDDSTTVSRVRRELNHNVTKLSDISHVKCHLRSSLYKLQAKHKVLTSSVIRYLVEKCFAYALLQNKGNVDGVRSALNNIVPHAFGDHSACGKWCKYNENPHAYTHKYLPNGKHLQGPDLRNDLVAVFQPLAENADKIASCSSTSQCESFNNMVAAKAPKSRHLSSSGSLNTRVACAVSQKNEGNTYLTDVFTSAGISPGSFYSKHGQRVDRKRVYMNEYRSTTEFKRRRLQFKQVKSTERLSNELREGKTYESRVDFQTIESEDIETIPPPTESVLYKPVTYTNPNFVYFDLETTSLERNCDIVQLSAVHKNSVFNRYVLPNKPIAEQAEIATKLQVKNGVLYYKNTQVHTVTIAQCVIDFIQWLRHDVQGEIILVAHNCKVFDAPRLLNHVSICNQAAEFGETVCGFVDTLPLFRAHYKNELTKFSQKSLADHFLHKEYNAHNAEDDAKILQEIVNVSKLTRQDMCQYSFSVQCIFQENKRWQCKKLHEISLQTLIHKKVCSAGIVGKIAASGLNLGHLKLAFSRNGAEGVAVLLSERDVNGRMRVTKSKKIIEKISDYFARLQ